MPAELEKIFQHFKKAVMERALSAEISHHSGYEPGEERAAAVMRLIHFAKLNGLAPYTCLRDVLERLSDASGQPDRKTARPPVADYLTTLSKRAMDADAEARRFVDRTRTKFPQEALTTDQWLRERGWASAEMTFVWIEAFADRTSEAVKRRDEAVIAAHTAFMATEHRQGSESVRSLVDVAYAENLMWDLDISDRVWAWPHIALTVRALYEAMWGAPKNANA